MNHSRSTFSNKLGFVLAAAGSAVGLGNIWRFPYLAAKYGGGVFLLIYLLLVVSFGFTLMITEVAIGRKTGLSPIGAFQKLNRKFAFIGVLGALVAFLILPYYSVIGGWVIKYLVTYLTGGHTAAAGDGFFEHFIGQPVEPVIWQVLFVLATFIVVVRGVNKGVERVSRILMPLLVILSVAIAVYSVTRPGALEGVKYFFLPNFDGFTWEKLVMTLLGAMGQMFYSMSLAMGIMITYGSYLRKQDNLEKSVAQIEIFDTVIAVLAGLMVIPAVFAFSGGESAAVNAGPGLMFVTIPKVFEAMGLSTVIGALFFVLVLFAALTSAISLMEAVVSVICDQLHLSRTLSSILAAVCAILLGLLSTFGYSIWSHVKLIGMQFLDFFDFITNSVLMPITALLTCIFVGYVIRTKTIADEVRISSNFHREGLYNVMVKYIAPIFLIAILVSSILNAFGTIKI